MLFKGTASVSLSSDRRRRSLQRSPTPLPRFPRQSLPPVQGTVIAAPVVDVQLSSPPPGASTSSAATRTPGRFSRGSVIQLGGGRWKRVEQLSDEDFVGSSALETDTQLESITVAHILHNHDRNTVVIGFQASAYQTQVRYVLPKKPND